MAKMGTLYEEMFVDIRVPSMYLETPLMKNYGMLPKLVPSMNPFNMDIMCFAKLFEKNNTDEFGYDSPGFTILINEYREHIDWELVSEPNKPLVFQTKIKFNWLEYKYTRVVTWLKHLAYTTTITNYYLPFVLATLSVILTLMTIWPDSGFEGFAIWWKKIFS